MRFVAWHKELFLSTCASKQQMRFFILAIVCHSCLLVSPVMSHGENSDCSDECESMYCPNKDSKKEGSEKGNL